MSDKERAEERRYRVHLTVELVLLALALLGWVLELKKLGAF